MWPDDKAVDNLYQFTIPKAPNRPPERRLTTPWLRCDKGFFRVDASIIGPKPKKPKNYLALSQAEAQAVLEAVAHIIELLEEELR